MKLVDNMAHAYEYDNTNTVHWHNRALDETHGKVYAELLKGIFPDAEGKACLDIACGTGVFLAHLAKQGAVAIGIDASPSILQTAESYLREQGLEVLRRSSPLEVKIDSSLKGKVQLVSGDMFTLGASGLPPCEYATWAFPYLGFDSKDLSFLRRLNQAFLEAIPATMTRNGYAHKSGIAREVFVNRRDLMRGRDERGFPTYALGERRLPDDFFDVTPYGQANIDLYLQVLARMNWTHITQLATISASHRLVFEEVYKVLRPGGCYILATYGAKTARQAADKDYDKGFCQNQFMGEQSPRREYMLMRAEFIPLGIDMAQEQNDVDKTSKVPEGYDTGVYLVDVRVEKTSL